MYKQTWIPSDEHLQGLSDIHVLAFTELPKVWVERHQCVLRAEIQGIVYAPIDLVERVSELNSITTETKGLTSRTFLAGWNKPCKT
jgi:hypothetical protein